MTKEQALEYVNNNCNMSEKFWHTENHHYGYYVEIQGMSKEKIIDLIEQIYK